jgi:hypothetical protein
MNNNIKGGNIMINKRVHSGRREEVKLLLKKGGRKELFHLSDMQGQHTTFDFAKKVEKSNHSLEKVAKITGVDLDHILKIFRSDSFFSPHDFEVFISHPF